MIQGGDPTGTGAGGESIWGNPFGDECKADVKFDKLGLLATANRGPNTNATGYEVVKKMETSPTAPGDRPIEPIKN